MKRYVKDVVAACAVVFPLLATPAAPEAQTPARPLTTAEIVAKFRQPGRIYLSGENPGMTLRDKPGGSAMTTVSFWRIHWSPAGTGHVCFVTTGDGKSPGDLRIALHDNQKLYDYMVDFYSQFNQSYKDRPFTAIGGAKFARSGDAIREHTEVCNSDEYRVSINWRRLREPYLFDRPPSPRGLVFVRIPAADGSITINGKPAPGAVHPAQVGGEVEAGLLAFGETWRGLE